MEKMNLGKEGKLIITFKNKKRICYDICFNNSVLMLNEIIKTVLRVNTKNDVVGYKLYVNKGVE